ncbi:MAG: nucleotidyltransferase domain-containing protein, partial [Ginsengibacter sp.]
KKEETYIRSRYFIMHIDIFGSYAKKEQRPDSDIDILYTTLPDAAMTLARLKSIEGYFSTLLDIEKAEMVSRQSINPVIGKNIEDYAISVF